MSVLPVLHLDDALVAIDKPSGMSSVPAPGDAPSAWRTLEAQLDCRLWAVHRLDRDASGVLVFARSAGAHRRLSLAFERRDVEKTYLALSVGCPDPPAGIIETPLHAARRGRMRPATPGEPGAQDAVTAYRTTRSWEVGGTRVALVEVRPRTGRHHQIRVHFRSRQAPLLFDRIYGRADALSGVDLTPVTPRLALHACRLAVPDPSGTGTTLIESPLPADLAALVEWLERNGRAARR